MNVKITRLGIEDSEIVFEWVMKLLVELGEEGEELGELNRANVLREWKGREGKYSVFAAYVEKRMVGILTLAVTFAIYANGEYGVIDEMYVDPEYRSAGVGAELVKAARNYGKSKGWARLDVTAPESERWERTRRFYEKQGFVFTGPKLKLLL